MSDVLAAPTDQPHRVADPDKPSPSTDPLDIEAFRRNGHALIDWVSDYYTRLGSMAVYEPVEPGAVRDWHLPLSRPFRSLKLWFVLRSFGAEGLRNMIRSHVDWARKLAAQIDSHPSLELMAPVPFAMVPFAHRGGNAATDALIATINSDGRFYVTGSEIRGRRYVRVAVGSIWTTRAHIEALWKLIEANA